MRGTKTQNENTKKTGQKRKRSTAQATLGEQIDSLKMPVFVVFFVCFVLKIPPECLVSLVDNKSTLSAR